MRAAVPSPAPARCLACPPDVSGRRLLPLVFISIDRKTAVQLDRHRRNRPAYPPGQLGTAAVPYGGTVGTKPTPRSDTRRWGRGERRWPEPPGWPCARRWPPLPQRLLVADEVHGQRDPLGPGKAFGVFAHLASQHGVPDAQRVRAGQCVRRRRLGIWRLGVENHTAFLVVLGGFGEGHAGPGDDGRAACRFIVVPSRRRRGTPGRRRSRFRRWRGTARTVRPRGRCRVGPLEPAA